MAAWHESISCLSLFPCIHGVWQTSLLGIANGGQNISCDSWGGGGTIGEPSKTGLGGLRKWDWSGLCPFPSKEMTGHVS